jgi:hypothetical protein
LFLAGLLGLAAVSGAACSGCSILSDNQGLLAGTPIDDKALYAVEAADFGAEAAAEAAVDSGLLKGADAAKAQSLLDQAHQALKAARDAYEAGDAKTFAARVASCQALVADAWAIIPQKKA